MDTVLRRASFPLVLSLLLAPACGRNDDDDPAPNRPPVIASLTAEPASVSPGGSAVLTAVVSDPDGDALAYDWSASGGTIMGTGSTVTWTAPMATGRVQITLAVDDGALNDEARLPIGVGPPNAWLWGTYGVVAFEHDYSSGGHIAATGTLTFDGAGAYTAVLSVNNDGVIESGTGADTYVISPSGDIALNDGSGAVFTGGLDPTGEAIVMARTTPGRNPLIAIAVKRVGGYAVSGDYHLAAFRWEAGAYAGSTGTAVFDAAASAIAYTVTMNSGGILSELTGTMSYSVGVDGSLAITDPADALFRMDGGVMVGGHVLIAATTGPGNGPMILVAVRKSGTLSSASLEGLHRSVSMEPTTAGASAWTGENVFDGLASWTSTGTVNDSGVVTPGSFAGSYAITPEGRMSLLLGTREFVLGVLEGGRAGAGAAVTAGEAPGFVFSVRK